MMSLVLLNRLINLGELKNKFYSINLSRIYVLIPTTNLLLIVIAKRQYFAF